MDPFEAKGKKWTNERTANTVKTLKEINEIHHAPSVVAFWQEKEGTVKVVQVPVDFASDELMQMIRKEVATNAASDPRNVKAPVDTLMI